MTEGKKEHCSTIETNWVPQTTMIDLVKKSYLYYIDLARNRMDSDKNGREKNCNHSLHRRKWQIY